MSARTFIIGFAATLGAVAFFGFLIGSMWWSDAQYERQRETRRAAQQQAYERANEMCDGRPRSIIPHDGLTWWLEVRCADGSVRAVPLEARP